MNKIIVLISVVVGGMLASSARAQFTIDWYSVDGGGMMGATGGTFELSSTAGQADASGPLAGGTFEIVGGFWAAANRRPECPADFNGDGFLDFFDYGDYVDCFENGVCPPGRTADFNGDAFVDFFDYADYVTAFETGC
ncbi:MAG: hypothetical protein HEQ23_08735 [Tepidisphaera sp.]